MHAYWKIDDFEPFQDLHILIIAFYLGTLMAAITEIIQKSDGLDFSSAEILSKGQMKFFAYNNIGKFSQNSQLS